MSLYFLDTSALVKQYHDESGSAVVNSLFDNSDNIFVIASITLAEFASAFTRKVNEGIISEEDLHFCLTEFSKDILLRFLIIDLERSHISKGI